VNKGWILSRFFTRDLTRGRKNRRPSLHETLVHSALEGVDLLGLMQREGDYPVKGLPEVPIEI
jgi:hypothetical protein